MKRLKQRWRIIGTSRLTTWRSPCILLISVKMPWLTVVARTVLSSRWRAFMRSHWVAMMRTVAWRSHWATWNRMPHMTVRRWSKSVTPLSSDQSSIRVATLRARTQTNLKFTSTRRLVRIRCRAREIETSWQALAVQLVSNKLTRVTKKPVEIILMLGPIEWILKRNTKKNK